MDSKNIIEEIDIIIRAKVEEARKDIRSVVKETEKMVSSVSGNMKKLDKSGQLDSFRKGLENARDELENLEEEVREIGVTMDGVKFKFNPKIEGDFTKQYEKAIEEAEKEMEKESSFSIKPDIDMEKVEKRKAELRAIAKEFNNPGSGGSSAPSPSSSSKGGKEVVEHHHPDSGLSKEYDVLREKIKASVQELKNLKAEASKLELKGMNPYEIMSFSDGFKLLRAQITETFPTLSQFKADVQANLSGALGDGTLLQKMALGFENLKTKISSAGVTIENKVNKIKTSISKVGGEISGKLAPITSVFGNIGKFGVATFNKVKTKLQSIGDTVSKPVGKLKTFINRIRSLGTEADKAKKKGSSLGSTFTKGFNGVGKAISSGVGSIKKFALSLLSVRGAFTMISRAAQSYLSFDTQLQDSITNSWNVLGSLLAPILEYVAGLFSKLVSVVATFVKTLTGVDLVAKANAKALDKQTKSAQKSAQAQKQLSGIDDIDTLSSGSGGGEETPTISVQEVDIKPLENFLNKAKDIFSKLFAPIKEAWDTSGQLVVDGVITALTGLGEFGSSVFGSLFEVWTNGTGMETLNIIFGIFGSIFSIIGEISSKLSEAWNKNNIGTQTVQNVWNGFNNLLTIIKGVFDTFRKKWDEIGQPVCDIFVNFINDLSEKFENLTEKFKEIWDGGGKYLFEKIIELGAKFIEIAGWIYDEFISPVIDWFIDKIVPALDPLFKALGNIIEVGIEIVDFIKNVFTGNWKKAFENIKGIISGCWDFIKNIFSAGGKIFVGIVDGISSAFKTMVNAIISGINKVIKVPFNVVNGLLNTIRNVNIPIIDVKPFKGLWDQNPLPVPQIPQLASGTVAYEPVVAQIAEYAGARNNPEIVSPVNMMKSAFRDVLNEFDTSGTRFDRLVINVAGENFYDDTIDYINDKSERMGVSVIKEM